MTHTTVDMGLTDDAADQENAAAITRILNRASTSQQASAELLPLIYDRLRRLARDRMRQERPDQTLQATALVHEAYLRLVDPARPTQWDGRWHFFAAAAEAMRRILIENARSRARLKRGGGLHRTNLDEVQLTVNEPSDDLLAIDEALERLAERHPEQAQLVKLRYFAGLTINEAAQAQGISTATAERRWAYARAWLYRHLDPGEAHER